MTHKEAEKEVKKLASTADQATYWYYSWYKRDEGYI
jgi:hypothetical protein